MKRRQLIQLGMAAAACGGPAWANTWPTRPVQLVCAFPPGSGVDFAARLLATRLASVLGQPFVVSNRAGAAGTVAAAHVAASPPDGYTLLVNSASHTLYPAMYSNLKFDAARDTVGIASICEVELILVTSPQKGLKSLQEVVEKFRKSSEELTFASAGHGSSTHIAFERLAHATGLRRVHIPFKGTPESVAEVVSGRVDLCYGVVASTLPLIKAGQLVPLAVSGKRRSATLPEVPTTEQAGYPESGYTSWIGLLGPTGTPPAVIERLSAEVGTALALPEISTRLLGAGQVPMIKTSGEFTAQLQGEYVSNAALIKAAGVKPQ
ncbi:MAG TPA: tripartite tricarboxylate transporter substrate-binding protein [Ramlibacter sp.]|nr:tripartite tricarboxylate transporter substrate-binding protein [Ramlibacter sp.]